MTRLMPNPRCANCGHGRRAHDSLACLVSNCLCASYDPDIDNWPVDDGPLDDHAIDRAEDAYLNHLIGERP